MPETRLVEFVMKLSASAIRLFFGSIKVPLDPALFNYSWEQAK
jgi:hypothetical protein